MKPKASQNDHRGSDFRDFLAGEGILLEVGVLALKRVVSSSGSRRVSAKKSSSGISCGFFFMAVALRLPNLRAASRARV